MLSGYPFKHTFSGPLSASEGFVCWDRCSSRCRSLEYVSVHFLSDIVRQAAIGITSSYDALLELFECLGSYVKRLEIYTTIPPTPIMTEVIVKVMAELLSVLALATRQIKQGRFSECIVTYTSPILNMSQRNSWRNCGGRTRYRLP